MKNRMYVVAILMISFLLFTTGSFYFHKQVKTLPLVPMMQQLLADIQQVDQGIYTESYSLIEKGSGQISDHPTMTSDDKELVKSTLGEEMQKFVEYDMIVHHHADSMRMAAINKNMQKVLQHYRIVQSGCVDCHANFRDRVSSARLEKSE
ncbi:MAG: hypothetical protein U5K72_20050 [Balneolaceae bacterium]|nr:hypothetical protein [Balneolaceae bacterium]